MLHDDAADQLQSLLRDVSDNDGLIVVPSTRLADVAGWDSLKTINLLVAIETRLGVRLRSSEIDKIERVGDLIDIVAARA